MALGGLSLIFLALVSGSGTSAEKGRIRSLAVLEWAPQGLKILYQRISPRHPRPERDWNRCENLV